MDEEVGDEGGADTPTGQGDQAVAEGEAGSGMLSREELYDLHHKPMQLTSFDKHFSYPFNQPIAVPLLSSHGDDGHLSDLPAVPGTETAEAISESRLAAREEAQP